MEFIVSRENIDECRGQAVVTVVFEDDRKVTGDLEILDNAAGGTISRLMESGEINGRFKEFTLIHSEKLPCQRILIMGLGKKDKFTIDIIRSISARAARLFRKINVNQMIFQKMDHLGIDAEQAAEAIVEGVMLGLYKFDKYKSQELKTNHNIKQVILLVDGIFNKEDVEKGITKGMVLAEATNYSRDMVNEPSNQMTPSIMAKMAVELASKYALEVDVLDEEEMKKLGMGAFLAVSKGSREPGKMIILKYKGSKGNPVIGLVGKGITFDSGGISIKSSEMMLKMYSDMAGAAAVMGAVMAAAKMKLPVNLVGVIPATENLPDGMAFKPGDIIKSLEGKTIEILSTDAEGRLILADALTYARKLGVDRIIDIATLTGGCVIALGNVASGIMGNNQELINQLIKAGEESSEKLWQLPLFEEYKDQIKSRVADLENSGGRAATTCTAGIFLQEFVGDTPWAHIDIAGTALIDKQAALTYGKKPYLPKEGATGIGVRTLYNFFESAAKSIKKETAIAHDRN